MNNRRAPAVASTCRKILALCIATSLYGCGGGADLPATYSAGSGDNPLDGGVINDDGRVIEMQLDSEGTALQTVSINGSGAGPSTIEFDGVVNGIAVPREIETNGGESALTIDRESEEIDFRVNAPFGIGEVEFGGPVPQELAVTRDILLPETRTSSQSAADLAADCDLVVDSVETFCSRYLDNRDASLDEVIGFATGIAEEALGSSIANGVVEGVVREFYDTLDTFCEGFTEVLEGTADSEPVDLCQAAR